MPLLLLESVLCLLIVSRVRYTKIDWDAYMEEVEGPIENGEFDYSMLKGETGPLVYPAGFVYVYGCLRWIAGGDGSDVRTAQYVFAAMYVATLAVVLMTYRVIGSKAGIPVFASALLCISKRVHSIFMLRMFNDCVAMLFLYVAVYIFVAVESPKRYVFGCVAYSTAVAVKMNIFLFAPGLLLIMLIDIGLKGAIKSISLCALVQIVLGAPFIAHDVEAYVRGAFGGFGDLKHKWTVNWKFVPEDTFLSKQMALTLLALHLTTLALFAHYRWCHGIGGLGSVNLWRSSEAGKTTRNKLCPRFVVSTLLECNFIGVVFCRSLHFQFYCWYWHALPLLLWSATSLPIACKFLTVAALEYAWSYGLDKAEGTSTSLTSLVLQLSHLTLLVSLWYAKPFGVFCEDTMKPPTRKTAGRGAMRGPCNKNN